MSITETPSFTFGQHLKRARELRGMTPEQMAEEAGVHASTIRNWEQDRRTPKKSVVVVYAGGNDVLRDWLMEAWEVRSRCGSIAEWDLEFDNLLVPA